RPKTCTVADLGRLSEKLKTRAKKLRLPPRRPSSMRPRKTVLNERPQDRRVVMSSGYPEVEPAQPPPGATGEPPRRGMSVGVNLFRASVSSSAPGRQPRAPHRLPRRLTTNVGSKPMTYEIKPLRGDTQMPRLSWRAALAAMALAAPAGAVLAQSAAPDAKPYQVEWVYRVKYGYQEEGWRIFQKYQIATLDRAR